MLAARLSVAALLLHSTAPGALFGRANDSAAKRSPAISLRKRLHINPLITEPDTIDLEWGGSFSTSGDFTLPASIHYTPKGPYMWWGRTEFSVSFDSLAYDGNASHFGDRTSFAATCVIHDGDKLDIALAPQGS